MNKKGFTLVELLAVIAILALLVIIALPNVLNMFNQAKKDIFLTEAKNVYKEVSKKYITENMRGNKITKVSNNKNKLDMESNNLTYNISLDDKGNIKHFQVSDGTYCISGSFNNLSELTTDEITEGECVEIEKSFKNDSWETIINNVRNSDIEGYNVGDTKEVDLGEYGTHTLRIANTSTPDECNTAGFSQTACGFVLEFADIITTHVMNSTSANAGGWPATEMRTFVNNDIYNALPTELKSGIIDTTVVSSYGSADTDNFISTDKLYLLSGEEIYEGFSDSYDTSKGTSRQLDYYKNAGVSTSNYSGAKKLNGTDADWWWLRSAGSIYGNGFYGVLFNGGWSSTCRANNTNGMAPGFRIG